MPIPKTRDVGKTIGFLKREKPEMPSKQRTAIALERARSAGADIPKRPKHSKLSSEELDMVRKAVGQVSLEDVGETFGDEEHKSYPTLHKINDESLDGIEECEVGDYVYILVCAQLTGKNLDQRSDIPAEGQPKTSNLKVLEVAMLGKEEDKGRYGEGEEEEAEEED